MLTAGFGARAFASCVTVRSRSGLRGSRLLEKRRAEARDDDDDDDEKEEEPVACGRTIIARPRIIGGNHPIQK
jgi:hypothetical protein